MRILYSVAELLLSLVVDDHFIKLFDAIKIKQ